MTVIKLFPVPMSQKKAAEPPLIIAFSLHASASDGSVEAQMLALVHHAEVLRRVVCRIPVDVVNVLGFQQPSA
jgi:hypothetical protein